MIPVHKDVLGAPDGTTLVVFVDDLNLPAQEAYGSCPTVELLRQLVSGLH